MSAAAGVVVVPRRTGARGLSVLALAVLRRQWQERRRYVLDLVTLIATTYVVFVLLLVGARTVGGAGSFTGDDAGGLVVGFVVVTLATLVYGSLAGGVAEEAARGTLEQIAMSPFGLPVVLLATTAAAAAFQVVEVSVLLALASWTSGVSLDVDPGSLLAALPAVVALLGGVQGLGLVLGGAALVAKRVSSLAQLLPLGFVLLVAAPVQETPGLGLLPVALPASLLRRVLVDGEPLPVGPTLVALAVAVGWALLGDAVFRLCDRVARDRALLGTY